MSFCFISTSNVFSSNNVRLIHFRGFDCSLWASLLLSRFQNATKRKSMYDKQKIMIQNKNWIFSKDCECYHWLWHNAVLYRLCKPFDSLWVYTYIYMEFLRTLKCRYVCVRRFKNNSDFSDIIDFFICFYLLERVRIFFIFSFHFICIRHLKRWHFY